MIDGISRQQRRRSLRSETAVEQRLSDGIGGAPSLGVSDPAPRARGVTLRDQQPVFIRVGPAAKHLADARFMLRQRRARGQQPTSTP